MAASTEYERTLEDARAAEAATLWEDAAALYERCLNDAPADSHAALLTWLGRCLRNAGEARPAWRFLMRATGLAREAGDRRGMAQASLEALRVWAPEERLRQIASEALEFLGPDESIEHVELLLWLERDDEARAIAARRGYGYVIAGLDHWAMRERFDRGEHDGYIASARATHGAFVEAGQFERASSVLRGAGYAVLSIGRLDDGVALAEEARAFAASVHMRFLEQLPALDVAGVAFARGDLDACEAVLEGIPGELDFRKDLYRMWVAEARGDMDAALALMPSPERAGGAFGALSQVHAGRGGLLYRAGRGDPARAELAGWTRAAVSDDRALADAPAIIECIVAMGDDATLRAIVDSGARWPENRYSTLQGRGTDHALGAATLRLGRADEAKRHFETGLAWAEAQGCPADAARCRAALEGCAGQ